MPTIMLTVPISIYCNRVLSLLSCLLDADGTDILHFINADLKVKPVRKLRKSAYPVPAWLGNSNLTSALR